MPAPNRYKCLNENCQIFRTEIFSALPKPIPRCPVCNCIKLEDWGPASNFNIGTGAVGRIDKKLSGLASQCGLGDIRNQGGRAAKTHQEPVPQGKYGTKNYFGVDVPIGDKPVTVHGSSAYSAFKVEAGGKKLPGNRAIPTQVTAAHKGNI